MRARSDYASEKRFELFLVGRGSFRYRQGADTHTYLIKVEATICVINLEIKVALADRARQNVGCAYLDRCRTVFEVLIASHEHGL